MTDHFGTVYSALLMDLVHEGAISTNARTGVRVSTYGGTYSFSIPMGKLQLPGNRAFYPKIAAAELGWMLLGTRDPSFVMQHAPKLWSKFIEDGQLKAAYGWRWREAFGRDQLQWAIAALKQDQSNRQCWVQAWDPSSDGCGYPQQPKNIPCPIGFSLNIIGGKLYMALFIRSSDAYVGLPYDVMVYSMLGNLIANQLGVTPGELHVTLANVHLYEPHWELANQDFGHVWKPESLDHPTLTLDWVARHPEALVNFFSGYKPEPALPKRLPELIE